ncbi:MAG: alkaline phosphatase D family protein, partial [Bacteroidota bacterium]
MKKNQLLILLAFTVAACQEPAKQSDTKSSGEASIRIVFGSCAEEDKPQPMLTVAAGLQPDVFVYLGDNIYGDTRDMEVLKAKYQRLADKAEFQILKQQTRLLSIWDDHDFGENDAGRHYPFKEASKEIFMDFWGVPTDSDRRKHPGIYGVEYLKKEGLTVQMILLDTRTFRDDLIHRAKEDSILHKNDYVPNASPDSTVLGDEQWAWLKQQFLSPADVRIVASSIQFSHEYNGWESWTNVPHEQQRMVDLIQETKANGIIFISGDVHWGEISKMTVENGYPVYDVTSSGITEVASVPIA